VAAFFQTNGVVTELKILPGKRHAFDSDRAVVIRVVGEQIKAQLTPEHPLPEFPGTKNYPFVLCILPAFLWVGFWIYLRRGSARSSRVIVGGPPTISQNIENRTSNTEHRKFKKWEIGLRVGSVILVTAAMAQTCIHVITPRLVVSDTTLRIAREWLLAPKWKEDFETLAAKPFWRGQRLKTLLTHVELSNYCVYELINWKVDKAIYDDYVLSPVIDVASGILPHVEGGHPAARNMDTNSPAMSFHPTSRFRRAGRTGSTSGGTPDATTDSELNWRRPLWEFFYPRIRKENSPEEAAEIVVRSLRERVTIISTDRMAAHSPSGIETIWKNQITDEKGFERIYVATLRSVGVGARLNFQGNAEFWTGSEWKRAPRPLITNWP